jgi:uncharacterized protein (DUF2267 family)
MNFQKYAQTGEAFLNEVARELGYPQDTKKAGRVLRSTLHVLRDQSTPEESMQLISQLPMFIKAVYVDGWNPGKQGKRVRRLSDFTARVKVVDGDSGNEDFTSEGQTLGAVQAVFRVLKAHVSSGEIEDVRRTLPEELRALLA